MISKFLLIAATVFLTFGFQTDACFHSKNDKRVTFGPSQSVSLAIYFKKETTNEDIQKFYNEVINLENNEIAIRFRVLKDDYEGVAISFSTKAAPDQREKLKKAIEESPIVYKVFENVVPDEIKDL